MNTSINQKLPSLNKQFNPNLKINTNRSSMNLHNKTNSQFVQQNSFDFTQKHKFSDLSYINSTRNKQLSHRQCTEPETADFQQNSKSNFYSTMKQYSTQQSINKDFSSLKASIINTKPISDGVKYKDLQKYMNEISTTTPYSIPFASTPPNRQQVLDLKKWFTQNITLLRKDNQLTTKALADKLQNVYSTCLSELIRQIGIECKERGELLQTVWTSYVRLLETLLKGYSENMEIMQNSIIQKSFEAESLARSPGLDNIIEFEEVKLEKDVLTERNNNYQKKILALTNELKQVYEELDLIKEKLQKAQFSIEIETKQDQMPTYKAPKGRSVVAHLMNFNNIEFVKSLRIQQIKQEELSFKEGLTERQIEQMLDEVTPIKFKRQSSKRIKTSRQGMMIETAIQVTPEQYSIECQTDEMIYHEIPEINAFIQKLIDKSIDNDDIESEESIFINTQRIISQCASLNVDEKNQITDALRTAQLQVRCIGQLKHSFTEVHLENENMRKKQINQMLEIQEQKANYKQLDSLLEEATQQFLQLLRRKNIKIKKLKSSKSKLLTKLNSMGLEQPNSLSAKKSKSPQSLTSFSFKKEDTINVLSGTEHDIYQPPSIKIGTEVQDDDDQIDKLDQINEIKEVNEDNDENENENESDENDSLSDEIDESRLLDESKCEEPESPQHKMNKIRDIVRRYGITRSTQKKSFNLQLIENVKESQKRVRRVYSQNQDVATQLLNKVLQKKKPPKKDAIIPFSSINKMFNQIITETLKSNEGYKIPMHVSVYDFFLKKYGFKNVAEQKIKQILQFIYHKRTQYPKMQLLARLCYMEGQMDETIYKLIVESQKYFHSKDILFNKQETCLSYEELNEYVINFLTPSLGQNYTQQFISNYKQGQQAITFEQSMLKIINLYFQKKKDFEASLKLIFQAADLDGNNLIEFSEFKTLYRAIHPSIYNKQKALQQFLDFADFQVDSTKDKMITLQRFAEAAIELHLFSYELLKGYSKGYEQIEQIWEENKAGIKYRYLKTEKFHKVKYAYSFLDEQIPKIQNGENSYDIETLFICYRLLNQKSKRVMLNYETRDTLYSLLPFQTLIIHETFNQIEDIVF